MKETYTRDRCKRRIKETHARDPSKEPKKETHKTDALTLRDQAMALFLKRDLYMSLFLYT